tara:strand:+ start:136 stop:915 length:780 start_codon:yes stop_codon:yes gene_type:complete
MNKLVEKVKEKKQFSKLLDSVVIRALEKSGEDVKKAREILRKYFGVFLTNKILKGNLSADEILKKHISTKNRDYKELYSRIFSEFSEGSENIEVGSVIDLGCGVNGFSYKYLKEVVGNAEGDVHYIGVEVVGQLVNLMNNYFRDRGFEKAHAIQMDLFDIGAVVKLLKQLESVKPRIAFIFNVVDALEFFEKDFSKKFLLEISNECEQIILSFPTESLSGKTKFQVLRKWLTDFIDKNFEVIDSFIISGEKFLILKNKK